MKETTARMLADLLLRHGGEQNNILAQVEAAEPADEPADEYLRIRSMIAHTMGSLWADALRPIFAEHPSLKPDGLE